MSGWIKAHRKIQNHWIWEDAKHFKMWMTILFEANHQEKKHRLGYEIITVQRGQSSKSIRVWASLFDCSTKTATKFLELLETDNMIKKEIIGKGKQSTTLVTVVNYDEYQDKEETQEKRKVDELETQSKHIGNDSETQEKRERDTNKNAKKIKNEEELEESEEGGVGDSHESHPLFPVFEKFENLLRVEYQTILEMPKQMDFREFAKLHGQFGSDLIFEELPKFSQNLTVLARDSVYRTFLNWLKKASIPEELEEFKAIWLEFYQKKTGEQYQWVTKDQSGMQNLLKKIEDSWKNKPKNSNKEFSKEEQLKAFNAILDHLPPFYQDKLSVAFFNSHYNEIQSQIISNKNGHGTKQAISRSQEARESGTRKNFRSSPAG